MNQGDPMSAAESLKSRVCWSFFPLLSSLLVSVAMASEEQGEKPVDADVLLVGGTIIDGSGEDAFVGDVAVRGDRIVAVGSFPKGEIQRTISCKGLIIAPGF